MSEFFHWQRVLYVTSYGTLWWKGIFVCLVFGKAFNGQISLKRHVRLCGGEKSFHCQCGENLPWNVIWKGILKDCMMLNSSLQYSSLLGCDPLERHIKRRELSTQQDRFLNSCKTFEVVYFMCQNDIYFLCECVLQKFSLLLKCHIADVLPQVSRWTAIFLELGYSSIKKLYINLLYIWIIYHLSKFKAFNVQNTHPISLELTCLVEKRTGYGPVVLVKIQNLDSFLTWN